MRSRPIPAPKAKLIALALAACFSAHAVAQLPTGGSQPGVFTAATNGNTMTFTTLRDRAFINQQQFSIGKGYGVDVIQPMVSSRALFNVTGPDPSRILGSLTSNGGVFLINPAGIYVGPGANINVASFLASTIRLSEADFLAGNLRFPGTPGAGKVENFGAITTTAGGSVYLVAPDVENHGIITAPNGEILLAAGKSVELVNTATPGVRIEITADAGQALNVGKLLAESGRIGLAGALVRNSGEISAASAVREGGRVFLKASQTVEVDDAGRILAGGTRGGHVTLDSDDTTLVAGRIDATGNQGPGGRVELLGDKVGLVRNGAIDASGRSGGGVVLVGGDFQGKNPAVRNASYTFVEDGTKIAADATEHGDGGRVIVWADQATFAAGHLSARGGEQGGAGGLIEVSGKEHLDYRGLADTRAPNGQAGVLLLDPTDITIDNSSTAYGGFSSYGGAMYWDGGGYTTSTITWTTIEANLATSDVYVTTHSTNGGGVGNITIAASPFGGDALNITHTDSTTFTNTYSATYKNPNSHKLSLWANGDININASFAEGAYGGVGGTGGIDMIAGWNGSGGPFGGTAGLAGTSGQIVFHDSVVASRGPMNLTAGALIQFFAYGGSAGIDMDAGALTMSANWIELLGAQFSSVSDRRAYVYSNGDQTFNITGNAPNSHLLLRGGDGTTAYGNSAQISRFGGSGGQQFNFGSSAYGSDLLLLAGSGTGVKPNPPAGSDCYGGSCSDNSASIRNLGGGGQTFTFTNGGNLTMSGGTAGSNNYAEIDNAVGALKIQGPASITLTGGTGGAFNSANQEALSNAAGITSNGTLEIVAGNMTLNGGGDSATYGGALIGAPKIDITLTGSLVLNGGASNVTLAGGLPGGAAAIGWADAPIEVNIDAGGNVSLNGGSGAGGMAAIGAINHSAAVTIRAGDGYGYGGVSMTSYGGVAMIGSLGTAAGGTVKITADWMELGNGRIQTGTSGTVDLETFNGSIHQSSTGAIITDSLVAKASADYGYADITLPGQNVVAHANLEASGKYSYNIAFNSAAPMTHVNANAHANANTAYAYAFYGGDITLTSFNTGSATHGDLALGSIVSDDANASIDISARRIFDDNGVGVVNVRGRNVTLTAEGSPSADALAISADVEFGNNLNATATGYGGNAYGGIRIFNVGTHEAAGDSSPYGYVTLQDNTSNGGPMHYKGVGTIDIGYSHYFYAKGDLTVETPGAGSDVYVSGSLSNSYGGIALIAGRDVETGNGGSVTTNGTDHDILLAAGHDVVIGDAASDSINAAGGKVEILAGNQVHVGTYGSVAGSTGVAIGKPDAKPNSVLIEGSVESNDGAVAILASNSITLDGGYVAGVTGIAMTSAGGSVSIVNGGHIYGNSDVLINGASVLIDAGSEIIGESGVGISANSVLIQGLVGSYGAVSMLGTTSVDVDGGSIFGFDGIAISGGSVAIRNGAIIGAYAKDVAIVAGGNLDIDASHLMAYAGNVGLSAGGNIQLSNFSSVLAGGTDPGLGNVVAEAGGNIHLSNGSSIVAANDVYLLLNGANSQLILNDAADVASAAAPAKIISKYRSPSVIACETNCTTYIDFPARTSGGVIIDGVETTTTAVDGSGFFVNDESTPAVPGASLIVTYAPGGGAANAVTSAVDSAVTTVANQDEDEEKRKTQPVSTEGQSNESQDKPGQCT